jgi:hypothetical protein
MKGKVLGYDAATGTGVINGDDGNRYKFSISDNKSPAPPKAGDEVDYVADAGAAKEIFIVAAAAAAAPPPGASIDMSKIAADPTVQNILAKPNVIWAGIILLGSLMAGYLFGALGMLGKIGGSVNVGFGYSVNTGLGIGALVFFLLVAIPVLAGLLIFMELTNHKLTQTVRLATGAAAVGGPIILPMLGGAMSGAGAGVGFDGLMMGLIMGTGGIYMFGMLVTIAGGALILLTHFGVIKKVG